MSDLDFGQDDELSADLDIDLNFGPDSVEAMPDRVLVEQGIYSLMATKVDVGRTKAGELMIIIDWSFEDDKRYDGVEITDRLVLPGLKRKQDEPKKWNMMMDLFRRKVESITGRAWREDKMKLNPRQDILGQIARGAIIHETSAYEDKNGIRKIGTNAVIAKYLKTGESFAFPDASLLSSAAGTTPGNSPQSGGSHI